jgi:hypothetical protein
MGGYLHNLHAHLRRGKVAGKLRAKSAKIAPKSGKVFNNLICLEKSDIENQFG